MVIGNEEHKQRVNISAAARTVIDADFALFGAKTFSGFLNRIITSFSQTADASIDNAVEEQRDQLLETLADMEDTAQKQRLMEMLLDDHRRHLCAKKEAYPKGESVMFRLNNANFDMLYVDGKEQDNYSSPAKYLKALLEEYARLSPADRERVYYAQTIEEVTDAICENAVVDAKLGNGHYLIRPYAVMADNYATHMYLVGMSRPKEDPRDDNERIVSLRVSRLTDVKLRRRHTLGKLTVDDRLDIEEKIRYAGVQYLIGDVETITLRLTPTGRQEFLQRAHQRPQPVKVTEDGVYTFRCTTRQVRHFFISFGKDVEILSPASLREEFVASYAAALDVYESFV